MKAINKILSVILCTCLIAFIVPFSTFAEDSPTYNITTNIVYTGRDSYVANDTSVHSTNFYQVVITINFDKSYFGTFTLHYTDNLDRSQSIGISGSTVTYTLGYSSYPTVSNIYIDSFNLTSSTDELSYSFPIESYTAILNFKSRGFSLVDVLGLNSSFYPIFTVPSWSNFIQINKADFDSSKKYCFVFGFNKLIKKYSEVENYLSMYFNDSDNLGYYSVTLLNTTLSSSNSNWSFVRIVFDYFPSNYDYLTLKTKTDLKIMPIYFGFLNGNVSNDFALDWGLSNDYISSLYNINRNVDIFVNGTESSSTSSSSLSSSNSSFKTSSDSLNTFESTSNDSLNSNLNNISTDVNFDTSSGSSYFKNSLNLVTTKFNELTTSTPFGSILGFSLVLGLALLIIGKVFK